MSYPTVAFLTLAVSAIFSPGPNNIMCMTLGQNIGFKKSTKYMMGALVGYTMVLILIALFNGIIVYYFPIINNFLKFVGVAYLLYLAGIIFYSSFLPQEKKKTAALIEEEKLFLTAIGLQFMNPKAVLFGITIMSTFAFPYFQDIFRISLLILVLVSMTLCSLMLWAGMGSLLHNFVKNHEKSFNTVMALLLIYCALVISGLIPFL